MASKTLVGREFGVYARNDHNGKMTVWGRCRPYVTQSERGNQMALFATRTPYSDQEQELFKGSAQDLYFLIRNGLACLANMRDGGKYLSGITSRNGGIHSVKNDLEHFLTQWRANNKR